MNESQEFDIIQEIVDLVDKRKGSCIDEDGSFDNLVYVEPDKDVHIRVKDLSLEQQKFLDKNLDWRDDDRISHGGDCGYVFFRLAWGDWCLYTSYAYGGKIYFNDIYKEKGL